MCRGRWQPKKLSKLTFNRIAGEVSVINQTIDLIEKEESILLRPKAWARRPRYGVIG
jgi:hypothetical protein